MRVGLRMPVAHGAATTAAAAVIMAKTAAAVVMVTATTAAMVTVLPLPKAEAAPPPPQKVLNGRYQMVTYASQKAGTSPAARQREGDFGAVFTLSTTCSGTRCVATVVDGPAPGNPSIPLPIRYVWNGSDWTNSYDWLWDCFLGEGRSKQWARASSWTNYTPQADGTLRGTWHTDIAEGACRGSVVMPVAAAPV